MNTIAKQKNYIVADSYKCFEIWLLLHKFNIDQLKKTDLKTSKKYKSYLKKNFPGIYSDDYDFENFFFIDENLKAGIENAKNEDKNSHSGWLMSMGTRVYKLIESIFE